MKNKYPLVIKPIFDRVFSFILIILLSPVFLVITCLLCIVNQGKPFFIQKRPGRHEKIFHIIKFKTMNDKTDANGQLLSDTERLTPIGDFVRKTSLDEIPQLFNLLKGDMSFIGPRPFLPNYLPYYTEEERKRHKVKPGITGHAQVNGRNFLDWDTKLKYDMDYVDHLSWKLDMTILFKTVYKVLGSKDIATNPSKIQPPLDIVRKKYNKPYSL